MSRSTSMLLVVMVFLPLGPAARGAEPPPASELNLGPGVLELLRAEMREIAVGVQGIAVALPIGGWDAIHETARRIHDSYIMNQQLTDAQARELETLPAPFHALDQALHRRAQKLAAAAHEQDAELVSFHFGRMLEACTECHAAYASQRFPGLQAAQRDEPVHHH